MPDRFFSFFQSFFLNRANIIFQLSNFCDISLQMKQV
jgi:hypothetical protein